MNENCTVYNTVDLISRRWSLLIILSVYKKGRKTRYSEIKRDLKDITPKILSSRLKLLEEEGILEKEIDQSTIPVKSFYSLTKSGSDLVNIIQDIKKWGLKWKHDNKACETTSCKDCNW